MKLTLNVFNIQDVQFGDRTEIVDRVLYINRLELQELLQEDQRLRKVEIELAHPGESCRILQVVDVVEPRAKIEGHSGDFPGALGKMESAGGGKTCVLRGTAVVLNDQSEAEDLSQQTEDALGFIIDMSGPAADIHLYGQLHNIVILPYPAEDPTRDGYRVAMKKASLKAAVYLAQVGKNIKPDEVEIYEAPPLAEIFKGMKALPKIAYILMVHCTSYPAIPGEPVLYGDNLQHFLPSVAHPNEVFDGAIVNPYEGVGTETYVIQNHPVIKELYERHGKDLCFVGVILTISHVTEPERERSAMMAANTAKSILGADGVILTKASSGAPDVDLAQTAQYCEELGLKSVLIIFDRSNQQEVGEVFNHPDVSAIVSTANQYEVLHLPAVERIIGKRVTLPNGISCDDKLDKVFRYIRGGLDQAGITNLMPVRF
ncbi:MAG: glycine/sarcosine/betaine reductase component B subunit [Anaerolineae bacterium]|nr:glycine/sarcosine/betaine reductase component B subunit [Anaerolineae bacterium]